MDGASSESDVGHQLPTVNHLQRFNHFPASDQVDMPIIIYILRNYIVRSDVSTSNQRLELFSDLYTRPLECC